VDLSAYGQLLFEGGASAQFSVSMRHPFRAGAHVVGEEAYILIERPWKPGLDGKRTALQLVTRDGAVETFRFAGISPYRYEVEAMESCIVDGSSPRVPLSMSREFLKSMLAVRESASTGRIVKVG
jgi:predicted dehydrogenase